MSDAIKTHRLTLGKHSEDVTEQQLAAIKASTGRGFSEYEVKELQPKKPADITTPATSAKPPKDAEKAA